MLSRERWSDNTAVELIVKKLQDWFHSLVVMLPNFAMAVIIVVVGAIASRWLQIAVKNVLARTTKNEAISNLLATISRIVLLCICLLWAFSLLHLDKTVTSMLAGVGVIGLALGFAFQDIAANFMAGFIMAIHRPFKVGDTVELASRMCRVLRINIRATEVETLDGLNILIPNREVFQNAIINYTQTDTRRMDLKVGTAYSDDMVAVRRVVIAAVQNVPHREQQREVELFFEEFGDSSIGFVVRIWLNNATQLAYLTARSEAMTAIKKAFDQNGITIPFPIRTLDFGAAVVGGERLDAMKLK